MRRRIAVIALCVTATVFAVTSAAAVDAGHGQHLALRPLDHPFLAFILTAFVVTVVMPGLMRPSVWRAVIRAGIGLLGLLVAAVGVIAVELPSDELHPREVVASGPDVQVVAWQYSYQDGLESRYARLRLRSREGLFSRDGAADLACFVYWGGWSGYPKWTSVSAEVTGHTLTVRTGDDRRWQVSFDPASLRPTTPMINRCAGAPGLSESGPEEPD
jgi:hypothetical protein